MMFRSVARRSRLAWLGCIGLGLFLSGCGTKTERGQDEGQANMQKLMQLVMKHRQKNNGRLPANEEAFKKFVKTLKTDELKELGIEDVDACLISPRDKKPYGFNFKVESEPPTKQGKSPAEGMKRPLLAWEQEGSGGKRYVLYAQGGSAVLMDDAEFNEQNSK